MSVQFSSVQFCCSLVFDSVIPWTAARQAFLSITNSQSLPKLMSIESVMPSNHLILCRPLLLPPSLFPSFRFFTDVSALHIRWPKYWSFSFHISPSNEQIVPLFCKDQLMCSPTCLSSQVPAPVPVIHFLMCWGPGMVLFPPRICCDSVGSTFSCALYCPSLPGSDFPLSESGVCYQSCRGLQGFFGQIC